MAEAGSATKAKTASGETPAHAKSTTSRTSREKGAATSRTSTTKTRARPAAKSAARSTTARATRPSGAKAAAKPSETTTAQRRAAAHAEEGVEVPVPVLTPKVRVMHIPMPGMSYVADAGRLMADYLPPPERLAFYGGLGLAAVFGAIDWPVAAAIGLGTMIARRSRSAMRVRQASDARS